MASRARRSAVVVSLGHDWGACFFMRLIKSRDPRESSLLPVLAMLLDTTIAEMLRVSGFSSDYSPDDAEDRWNLARQIAERNGMRWLLGELEMEIRMPERHLTIPDSGSGIAFTWSFQANGGLMDDGIIKAVCVQAFDDAFVFDSCLERPLPVSVYQQIMDEIGAKVVKIIRREKSQSP